MTLKIVQVVGASTGGVRAHIGQVLALLSHHQLLLVAPDNYTSKHIYHLNINSRPSGHDLQIIMRLRRPLLGSNIVHAHGLRAGAFCALALLVLDLESKIKKSYLSASVRNSPKLIVTLHNLPGPRRSVALMGTILGKIIGYRADALLWVSQDIGRWSKLCRVPLGERALVPAPDLNNKANETADINQHAIAPEVFPARLKTTAKPHLLVTIARLTKEKGLEDLLAVVQILTKQRQDFNWVVLGDGPLFSKLRQQIASQNLPIHLLGYQIDVMPWLQACDLVVSCSHGEGQPVNISQALQLGKAIVATDVGGTAEVTGTGAHLVPVADIEALAQAITTLLDDKGARQKLADRAKNQAKALPTPADLAAQLDGWYNKLAQMD